MLCKERVVKFPYSGIKAFAEYFEKQECDFKWYITQQALPFMVDYIDTNSKRLIDIDLVTYCQLIKGDYSNASVSFIKKGILI